MLTDAYGGNIKYPMGLPPNSALSPICGEGQSSSSLYCTEYNLHVLFYVVERMWQYILDDNNPVWHLDICGGDELKEFFLKGGEREKAFWRKLCTDNEVRENGWLVPFLEDYLAMTSTSTLPQLQLSLLQPTDGSIILTKEVRGLKKNVDSTFKNTKLTTSLSRPA